MRFSSLTLLLGFFITSAALAEETRATGAASFATEVFTDGTFVAGPNAWIDVSRSLRRFEAGVHLSVLADQPLALRDDGSMIWGAWRANERGDGLRLEVHPLSSRRLRLGTIEPVRVRLQLPRASPSASLALTGQWRGFTTFLWTQLGKQPHAVTEEPELRAATFAGVGWQGGGFSLTGTLLSVPFGPLPYSNRPVVAEDGGLLGAHGAVAFSRGGDIPEPVDFNWESDDADRWITFFPDEEPTEGAAFRVAAEGAFLTQKLTTPDRSSTFEAPTLAGGLSAHARFGRVRWHLRATKRSAQFIQAPAPGLPPFTAIPSNARDEHQLRLGSEYAFGTALPRIGIAVAVIEPASFRADAQWPFSVTHTVLINNLNVVTVLPERATVGLNLEGKATLSWQPVPLLGIAAEAVVSHDPNKVRFSNGVPGLAQPVSLDPLSFGARTMLQLRF